MIASPVAWRPRCQRDLDKARELVGGALVEWQTRWFDRMPFLIGGIAHLAAADSLPHDENTVTLASCDGFRIDAAVDVDVEHLLIEAAFGTTAETYRTDTCHASLKAISTDMLDDLVDALESAFSLPGRAQSRTSPAETHRPAMPAPPFGAVLLTLTTHAGTDAWSLVIDVRYIWSRDPIPPSSGAAGISGNPGTTRQDALDDIPVELSVRLGRSRLSASALATLSVGDVIALDQMLDAPLPLIVDATGKPLAWGMPGRTGSVLSFQLTSVSTPRLP